MKLVKNPESFRIGIFFPSSMIATHILRTKLTVCVYFLVYGLTSFIEINNVTFQDVPVTCMRIVSTRVIWSIFL